MTLMVTYLFCLFISVIPQGYILDGVDCLGLCINEDVVFVSQMVTLNLTDFAMDPYRIYQRMINALFFIKLLLSLAFILDDIYSNLIIVK